MPDFLTQEELDNEHPQEWVKYVEDKEEWVTDLLNELANGCPETVQLLCEYIENTPAPLPPNKR